MTCNLHRWRTLKSGDLQVAITNLPFFTAERVSAFTSQEDLKSCLLASSSAWPFAPLVFRRGMWCIDGGLSDFQPLVDEDTITVSPFYFSDADIKPSRYVPLWWSFIPPRSYDTIDWLYALGYEDTITFCNKSIPGFTANSKMARRAHSYDIRSSMKGAKGAVGRFLGYDTTSLADSMAVTKYFGQFLDFMLLIVLVLIWKPFALLCIYFEISIWASFCSLYSIVLEIYELYPIISLCMGFFAPDLALICSLATLCLIQKVIFLGPSKYNKMKEIVDCVSCLWSVSLLMRFLTGGPSSVTLRKHDKLARNSMVYRVFRHMI